MKTVPPWNRNISMMAVSYSQNITNMVIVFVYTMKTNHIINHTSVGVVAIHGMNVAVFNS